MQSPPLSWAFYAKESKWHLEDEYRVLRKSLTPTNPFARGAGGQAASASAAGAWSASSAREPGKYCPHRSLCEPILFPEGEAGSVIGTRFRGDDESGHAAASPSSKASRPLSNCSGRGGQPRICRSTGTTAATPPTTA